MAKINDNDVTFCKLAIHSTEEQEYTMSFACVNPKEVILLESFFKVIVVDTTGKSNSEKRSLSSLLEGKIYMETCQFSYVF